MKKALSLILAIILLAGMIPAGALTLSAAAQADTAAVGEEDYDYTDPSNPYIATDFEGLRSVFNKKRDGGTVYIRLRRDIIFRDDSGSPEALTTNGANVVLDLSGFTLSYTAMKTYALFGYKGKITIKDSQRYDSSSRKWISGKVEYDYEKPSSLWTEWVVWYDGTSVLAGDIAVMGGTFINHNSLTNDSLDSGYCGNTLEMYGGVFEAEYPLDLTDSYNTQNKNKKVLIDGGTFRVKGGMAVLDAFNSDGRDYVTVRNLEMVNIGGDRALAYYVDVSDKVEYSSANDLFDRFFKRYPDGTAVFIDGDLQSSVRSGMLFDGDSKVLGPAFDSTFYVKSLSYINELELSVEAPEPGDQISYAATPQSGAHYVINTSYSDSSWENGVMWGTDSNPLKVADNNKFIGGNSYTVTIAVGLSDKFSYRLADKNSLTATVNGKKASVIWINDENCMVQCAFDIEIYEIDSVAVTVPEPEEGGLITYTASTPESSGYEASGYNYNTLWKNGVRWEQSKNVFVDLSTEETNYFLGSTTYRLSVNLTPSNTDKYRFANVSGMTATINGAEAEIRDALDGTITVSCRFTVRTALDSFAVTMREPEEGGEVRYSASYKSGNGYKVADYTGLDTWKSGVMWTRGEMWSPDFEALDPDDSNLFEAGETYTAFVMITLSRPDIYKFADADKCTATINGSAAAVYKISDSEYGIYRSFTIPGKKTINKVALTVSEPEAGTLVQFFATVPKGAGYRLGDYMSDNMWENGVMWILDGKNLSAADNNVFISGRTYSVCIAIEIADSDRYELADNVTATVNGREAQIGKFENSDTRYYVWCSFTVPGPLEIDTIEVTVTEPKDGAARSYAAAVPSGKGYMVEDYNSTCWKNGVCWADKNGGIPVADSGAFEAGEEYTVYVSIDLTDREKFAFIAKAANMKATVNGKEASVKYYSDGTCGVSCTFTASEAGGYLVGDVNDDAVVNNRDAMLLDRYVAGWIGYEEKIVNKDAADLNRDTQITNRDAMILDRYIAGWDGYAKYIIMV